MVDYNVVIPGGGSNALNPMALMALQQRGQIGQGNLAYKEQLLALKQQQVDNALANAGAGRAKSDYELNQMKAVRDVLANRVSPAVVGKQGQSYSGTGVSTDLNEGLYDKLLGTGDLTSANAYLTGQNTAATTGETNARTAGLNFDNISKQYKAENDALAQVAANAEHITDSDTLLAVNAALHGPTSPLKSMFDRMGITPEKSQADLQQVIATQGFDRALSLFSQGAAKTLEAHNANLKSQADVSQSNATTAKTQAQTAAIEAGKTQSSMDERIFTTLSKVLTNPDFASTPEYAQVYELASRPILTDVLGPNGETTKAYVSRHLPDWAVPPKIGTTPAAAAPVAAQVNQLLGAQATAVPAGGVANALSQLQGAAPTPAPTNSLAASAPAPAANGSIVTKGEPAQVVNVPGEGQFVVNPSTKTAEAIKVAGQEAPLGREKQAEGRAKVDTILESLAKNYATLNDLQGMPSERSSALSNIKNYTASTHLGQEVGKALGTPEQTQRNLITSAARDLLEQIKIATGMGTQELNSNFELENMLKTVTDPTQSLETVKARLGDMARQFGTGKFDVNKIFGKSDTATSTSAAKPMLTPPPKAVDMLKKDPSTRDHFDEIFGAGAAAKILGQ